MPDASARDGGEEVRVWVGMNEEAHERLRVGKNRLALKDTQTQPQPQLRSRELKTEVLHDTIVKVAMAFLTAHEEAGIKRTTPAAQPTRMNTVAAIMKFFGAKRDGCEWKGGEVTDRTVHTCRQQAEVEAQIVIDWLMTLFLLQSRTMLGNAGASGPDG